MYDTAARSSWWYRACTAAHKKHGDIFCHLVLPVFVLLFVFFFWRMDKTEGLDRHAFTYRMCFCHLTWLFVRVLHTVASMCAAASGGFAPPA